MLAKEADTGRSEELQPFMQSIYYTIVDFTLYGDYQRIPLGFAIQGKKDVTQFNLYFKVFSLAPVLRID